MLWLLKRLERGLWGLEKAVGAARSRLLRAIKDLDKRAQREEMAADRANLEAAAARVQDEIRISRALRGIGVVAAECV